MVLDGSAAAFFEHFAPYGQSVCNAAPQRSVGDWLGKLMAGLNSPARFEAAPAREDVAPSDHPSSPDSVLVFRPVQIPLPSAREVDQKRQRDLCSLSLLSRASALARVNPLVTLRSLMQEHAASLGEAALLALRMG